LAEMNSSTSRLLRIGTVLILERESYERGCRGCKLGREATAVTLPGKRA